ncbi:uncharacterized protein LOC124478643 isoform X2 [Hypomesus transpacificus]|uniref:uncharacterized protein LOC124478643 isoform X2 n=1 Tax=Hypomesus transpacificus TaxID=137520 RepID=UPI001F07A782|nr:uncharacterized protein LOC124478643 isoform X2 [Hypomesus transpacificus]
MNHNVILKSLLMLMFILQVRLDEPNLASKQGHSNCSQNQHCILNVASKEASFCIQNLTLEHGGVYWATLFSKNKQTPLLHSNKLSLHLNIENHTTVPPQSIHTTEGPTTSNINIFYIILAGLVVPIIVFISGLLVWFCWILLHSDPSQQNDLAAKSQMTEENSKATVAVHSVEYGILDFHSHHTGGEGPNHRPDIVIRSTDSVEYAAITFQRPQQGLVGDKADLYSSTHHII